MRKKILVFICLVTFFASCSKYEDGPSFSLLTKTQRLTGTWDLKKVIINGEESSSMSNSNTYTYDWYCAGMYYTYDLIYSNSYETSWEFEKDGDFSQITYNTYNQQILDSFSCVTFQAYISNNISESSDFYYGDWEFSSDKEEIELDWNENSDFEIIRLTDKELNIEQKYDGIKTEYQFEKQ